MRLFHVIDDCKKHHINKADGIYFSLVLDQIWATPFRVFQEQSTSWIPSACLRCPPVQVGQDAVATVLQMNSLYCTRCQCSHREMHFSAKGLQQESHETRSCKMQKRQVPVCKHLYLDLRMIRWLASRKRTFSLSCEGHHYGTGTREHPGCQFSGQARVRAQELQYNQISVELSSCSHIRPERLASGRLCPTSLRNEFRLLEERNKHCPWQPAFKLATANPLRLFDPHVCDCVDWFGGLTSASDKA